MVHETVEISAHFLDYNLDSVAQQQQQQKQQQQQQQIHLTRSHSSHSACGFESSAQDQSTLLAKDLLSVSLNTRLLPNSAENLSWKFFEQVSSLDNQLRGENEQIGTLTNDCHLMSTSVSNSNAAIYDATSATAIVNSLLVDGTHRETIARKTNGFANSICDDILSQHADPDLIQPPPPQQHQNSSFKFTSPTATFKRKKQQQQQQQQQLNQQQQQINNNIYNNNQSHTQANNKHLLQIPYDHHQQQQQQQQQQQHPQPLPTTTPSKHQRQLSIGNCGNSAKATTNNLGLVKPPQRNATTATITANATTATKASLISGIGVHNTVSDTANETAATATTTTATRATKTRTLPAISTAKPRYTRQQQAYAAESVASFVGNTKAPATASVGRKHGHKLPSMGATLQGGHSSSSGGSSSHHHHQQQQHKGSSGFVNDIETHLGLIGWRKKCLYTLLVLLMLLIVTNLMLTLWILKVMEFSTEGMGQLKIVPGGIQLTGQALIMDMLRASTIRSRHGQPIAIESSRNFSINTRDTNGMLENHLFLGHDKLECLSTGFRINDTAGRNLFSVNRNEVTIGAHALRIDGEGGAIFRESIQTPHVRAEPGRELKLESPTRQLELTAARDINLQSRAGGIELSALEDIKLSALDGSLRLESTKILMPNLRTAQPPLPGAAQSRDHLHRVFQLCACSNGKLFLASPHSICAGDDSTVCR